MNHIGTKTLKTDRLTLRRINHSDIVPAFKNWTSDDKVTEFLRWPTHLDISITEFVFNDWIKSYEKDHFYQWVIVLNDIDEPIGTIGVVELKEIIQTVHIGYCIGSKWWNKGIVTEAFAEVIKYFFDEIKVNRVEAQHDPNNISSGRVMIKCGLKYEGTMRQADISNKGVVDTAVYGLLADEYYNKI